MQQAKTKLGAPDSAVATVVCDVTVEDDCARLADTAIDIFGKINRRGIADKIRCVAIAPGYVWTEMLDGKNQKALDKIRSDVPINRLIDPHEVAFLVGELYKNEALAGDTYFIHGGLRLGSRG